MHAACDKNINLIYSAAGCSPFFPVQEGSRYAKLFEALYSYLIHYLNLVLIKMR
jgi:hypothetical protein